MNTADKRFGLLRNVLRAFGLSQEAVDDIVDWIADLLAGKDETAAQAADFPYRLRDTFLSAAELNFYTVLTSAVGQRAEVCAKVGLGDLFWAKTDDQSRYRIYTNKIDRKHVDFLLCDSVTMRPLVGIELDDRSHQRPDRQARDEFVDKVFGAASLPILHVPARRSYVPAEIAAQIAPFLSPAALPTKVATISDPTPVVENAAPRCPKCGQEMILRTAKTGANAGRKFWGCSNFPNCRAMLPYDG